MRKVLCLAVALFVFVSSLPFTAAAREKPVRAAVLSDLHYVPAQMTGSYCGAFMHYYAADTRQHPQSDDLLESAQRHRLNVLPGKYTHFK